MASKSETGKCRRLRIERLTKKRNSRRHRYHQPPDDSASSYPEMEKVLLNGVLSLRIFSFLGIADVAQSEAVCQFWRAKLVESDELIWKPLLQSNGLLLDSREIDHKKLWQQANSDQERVYWKMYCRSKVLERAERIRSELEREQREAAERAERQRRDAAERAERQRRESSMTETRRLVINYSLEAERFWKRRERWAYSNIRGGRW